MGKIPTPTLEICSQELEACARHRAMSLNPWSKVEPAVLRTMIYRGMAGVGDWSLFDGRRDLQHDLLICAELNPPVWGGTRNCEDQHHLYHFGMCIGCMTYVHFYPYAAIPILTMCTDCYSNTHRYNPNSIPFWYTIDTWPVTRVEECMDYLRVNAKRNEQCFQWTK